MATYKELLGLEEADLKMKDIEEKQEKEEKRLEKLLEKAWKIRDFEIELFWKRATYFSTIVGALFVGYHAINIEERAFIALLGSVSSLVWLLSNLGSKFWQKNWEKHIDLLEKEIKSGDIYKVVLGGRCGAFSVSKLSIALSAIIFISWIYLYLISISKTFIPVNWGSWLGLSVFLLFIGIILLTCRTSFRGKEDKIEGTNISYYKREI